MKYPLLFSPAKIGQLHLPNRILMGSMHLGYEGVPGGTERMAEFYAARARGGAALIITGGCAINAEAIGGANFSCIFNADDVYGLRSIASKVHSAGGRIGLQLFHAGRYASREWLSGLQPVAPSALRSSLHPATPRAMSEEDIVRTIADFASSAVSAREAGFDCVEVMGSEGYLINQFLSPLTNRRDDQWGGSIENRSRFGVETMKQIRAACGADFTVIFRMSGIDLMPGSSSWEDTIFFAQAVEAAGADALNLGIGWHESRIPTISMMVPRGYYRFVSARIRKNVGIPCICSNRVNDADVAEQILAEGAADFVSMARALLSDPELPMKSAAGRADLVATCIACNQACLDNAFRNSPTTCILNPEAGREVEMRLQPASFRKRVAVVGAGPAGLEAAKVLAQRGHRVSLFEKQENIGGQLLYAVKVPGKQEFLNTIRYYQSYLLHLGVRIELRTTPSISDLERFDAVVIATGAKPANPEIPGMDHAFCWSYDRFFQTPQTELPANILIIGAGGIGCDIAHLLAGGEYPPVNFFDDPQRVIAYEEFLSANRPQGTITLTRRGKRIGERLGPTTRWALIQLLEKRGVRMVTQIAYQSVSDKGLIAVSRTGKEIVIPAEVIVFATGQIPDRSLFERLQTHVESCFLVGSADRASETNAQTAIWDAAELARKI